MSPESGLRVLSLTHAGNHQVPVFLFNQDVPIAASPAADKGPPGDPVHVPRQANIGLVVDKVSDHNQPAPHRRVSATDLEAAKFRPLPSHRFARTFGQRTRTERPLRLDAAPGQSLCKVIMRKDISGKSVRDQVSSMIQNGFAA